MNTLAGARRLGHRIASSSLLYFLVAIPFAAAVIGVNLLWRTPPSSHLPDKLGRLVGGAYWPGGSFGQDRTQVEAEAATLLVHGIFPLLKGAELVVVGNDSRLNPGRLLCVAGARREDCRRLVEK